jgi:hypothetical protein
LNSDLRGERLRYFYDYGLSVFAYTYEERGVFLTGIGFISFLLLRGTLGANLSPRQLILLAVGFNSLLSLDI